MNEKKQIDVYAFQREMICNLTVECNKLRSQVNYLLKKVSVLNDAVIELMREKRDENP